MYYEIGTCKFCNQVTCCCENCMNERKGFCSTCFEKMKDEHAYSLPLNKDGKKRPYEAEPMPLSRVKD